MLTKEQLAPHEETIKGLYIRAVAADQAELHPWWNNLGGRGKYLAFRAGRDGWKNKKDAEMLAKLFRGMNRHAEVGTDRRVRAWIEDQETLVRSFLRSPEALGDPIDEGTEQGLQQSVQSSQPVRHKPVLKLVTSPTGSSAGKLDDAYDHMVKDLGS